MLFKVLAALLVVSGLATLLFIALLAAGSRRRSPLPPAERPARQLHIVAKKVTDDSESKQRR
jgi:hypothetical protein